MKLTKLQEKEIMRVHEAYWDSYLKGDVTSMTTLLDEHYTQVGSAEGEVFSNKKDAVQFLHDTIDQVAGKLEMRNRVTKIEVDSKTGLGDTPCLVHERADIYVLDGKEWIFYSKFRASTLLQKRGKEWKIIHQHSSFPDTRAEEGQNIATEKIAAENLQLREAVKRRTTELEQKSRELEIEASLERVRAIALSMRKPDDLPGICEVLFIELHHLGFSEIRNAMINIHDDDKGTFINYDYSDEIGRSINHLQYNIHPLIEKQIKQIRSAGDAFSETSFAGKDLKEWKKFRKKIGEKDDPRIKNIDALHYYFYSIGTGSIGISTFSAITDEKRNVLKRFRNVFDFAYRRYMDVAQAEAQAKEAQIEVALERVRARAMAMHTSSELIDVANVLRDQMGLLGQHQIETMAIHLYYDHEETFDSWYAGRDQSGKLVSGTTRFKKDSCWLLREALTGYHSHQTEYDIEASGENLQEWLSVLVAAAPEYESILKDFPEKSYYHITDFSGGSMIMVAYQPPTDETKALQKRCANVFDLAYRRFMDIKQAEAQTREAQIELALERVRARTMAMHDSSELSETAQVLFQQFAIMGGIPDRISIGIVDEKNEVVNFWTTDQTGSQIAKSFQARLNESTTIAKAYAAWKNQDKFLLVDLQGKELKDWIRFAREEMGIIVKDDFFKDRRVHHMAIFSHGWIMLSSHEPQSPETINILERFASVFNLTFRRFLDLQKAEAQTREAQIETALERIRSRSMAMHQSKELSEVASVVFEQLNKLGISIIRTWINIFNAELKISEVWITSLFEANAYPVKVVLPLDKNDFIIALHKQWKDGAEYLSYSFVGDEAVEYNKALRELTGDATLIPDSILNEFPSYYLYEGCHKYGTVGVSFFEPVSKENGEIIKRFTKVFEQTYTRFLDLQKAEVQAREAKIEVALERTRTQSMVMQHSNELDDTLRVFHEQVLLLGIHSAFSYLWLPDEDKDRHIFWAVWAENVLMDPLSKKVSAVFKSKAINYPLDRNEPATAECIVDWKGKEPVVTYHIPPSGVERYFATWQELIVGVEHLKPEYFSDGLYYVEAFMKYGCFGVIAVTDLPEEEKKILGRVAIEFERTYTRFLDLQKAEAQAREAEIQLALERVRARSLAMHHTSELQDIVDIVAQQLYHIGMEINGGVVITINDEVDEDLPLWASSGAADYVQKVVVPFFDRPIFTDLRDAIKRRNNFFRNEYGKEEKDEMFDHLFRYAPWSSSPEERKKELLSREGGLTRSAAISQYTSIAITNHNGKKFSEEEHEILKRFGNVFEQTYTRFLDLQKAEAQAKEAQIELGLERVRARAMAMQKSDELKELIGTVYNELTKLDLSLDRCLIWVMNSEDFSSRLWMANAESQPVSFYISHHDNPPYLAFVKAWKDRNRRWFYDLHGQEKKEWDEYVFNQTEMKYLPEPVKKNMQATDRVMLSGSFHNFGCLQTAGPEPLKEEQFDILNRFAKVFDLTYTRFNDLKQAEAQARESQIQLALERVRARTMAMQRSDELMETAVVLFDQLNQLGENIERTIIGVMNEEELVVDVWATRSDGSQMVKMQKFPIDEPIVMQKVYAAWRQQKKSIIIDLQGEELEIYFQFLKGRSSQLKRESFGERRVENFAFFSKGMLGIINADPNTPANVELYERFAAVFEQTYTRFLDLQKAEGQARESQIELGLERVRARAMAMQKSDELSELVDTVFKELTKLDFALTWCIINIIDEPSMSNTVWAANPDINMAPESYHMLFEDYPFHHAMMKGWKERKTKQVYTLEGSEKKIYDDYLFNETEFKRTPEAAQAASRSMEKYVVSFSFSNFGGLQTVGDAPLSDANLDILSHFGKVFDLTYTRFNDLKQAEAQAREAQIQLALERVRARTMAMQRSDELKDAAALLFQQVKSLGAPAYSCGYNIWEKNEKEFTSWMSTQDGSIINGVPNIPLMEDANFIRYVESKEKGEQFFVLELRGERMQEHYEYLKTIPAFKAYFDYAISIGFDLPETQIHHLANFSNGNLLFITLEPCPEFHDVFKRFAAVFEQTYTRFLDLQKAEAQAREAQVEAALERVRSRTMAMQRSDELSEAASLLFQQVQSLGAPSWTAGYCIWDEDKKAITLWMSSPSGGIQPPFRAPLDENPTFIRYLEADNKGMELYIEEESGKVPEENYQYLLTLPVVGEILNAIMKEGYPLPTYQVDHCAYFSKGFLLFITYQQVPELHDIFKRFAAVFDQTYTRFLDLQKAEAQAREAQIQLALERVRARTMAMQHSEELTDTAAVIFHQIKELGIHQWGNSFQLWEDDMKAVEAWTCTQGIEVKRFKIPTTEDPVMINIVNAAQKGEILYVEEMGGEVLEDHYKFMYSLPVFKEILDNLAAAGITPPKFQVMYAAYFSYGYILFITHEPNPEAQDIFKRFAKVFEQTYTRFLDLQKAEAQVREAQIETALERVRSRSIGMQKSIELGEVVHLLDSEIGGLGIKVDNTNIITDFTEKKKGINNWLAARGKSFLEKFNIPFNDSYPIMKKFVDALSKGVDYYSEKYNKAEKNKYFKWLFEYSEFKTTTKEQQQAVFNAPGWTRAVVVSKNSVLIFQRFRVEEYTEEESGIFKRFGRVFEQSYTRFLDLQKAEAQAREAQIEAALEKVRSRTMAMQKSEDLNKAASDMFKQIQVLGMQPWACGFNIFDKDEKAVTQYMSMADGGISPPFRTPLTEDPFFISIYDARQGREDLLVMESSGKELEETYRYMFSLPGSKEIFGDLENSGIEMPKFQITHCAYFSQGYLVFITYEHVTEAHEIFKRFAKVFEQTYTRFLDLQKAEEQAREAQIEAALERVRSRSMAMHKSDELLEAGDIIFVEMQKLGIESLTAGLVIMDKEEKNGLNYAPDPSSKKMHPLPIIIPHNETIHMQQVVENWKKGSPFFIVELDEDETIQHQTFIAERSTNFPLTAAQLLAISPAKLFLHNFYFKEGYVLIVGGIRLSAEQIDIMLRFAKVFQQTYTRFLDLQKAEASAREAQIETALERVRSRSMGMQKSEELKQVIQVVYDQFVQLKIHIEHTGFIMDYKERDDMHIWLADQHEVPSQVTIPYFDSAHWNSFNEAKANGKNLFVNHLTFEEKNKFYQDLFKLLPGVSEDAKEYYFNAPGLAISTVLLDNVGLYIENFSAIPYTYEENNTLMRFGKVFQQTYTRFLDLQKAEAQAREAQIEAGLERVRSRAMAIRKSDELGEVIQIIFNELNKLGTDLMECSIATYDDTNPKDLIFWSAGPFGSAQSSSTKLQYIDHPLLIELLNDFKSGTPYRSGEYSGELLETWWDRIFVETDFKYAPKDFIESWKKIKQVFYSQAAMNHGFLEFLGAVPLPEDKVQILKRFTNVIDLTYTRYDDVVKAEAQAREAQIETALERVRSRSMGMQKSEELRDVIKVIYEQLVQLGFKNSNAGFAMDYRESDDWNLWMADAFLEYPTNVFIPYLGHPQQNFFKEAKEKGLDFYTSRLTLEEKNTWIELVFEYTPGMTEEIKKSLLEGTGLITSCVFMKDVALYILKLSSIPYSDAENAILKRFSKVFEQTYTRFNDLKNAEAQAREAIKRASVDRVRAEIASMRTTHDLERIIPLIWNELITLGVPFIRCGVFIVDEVQKQIQTLLSTPEGKSIASFQLPFENTEPLPELLPHWQRKEIYKQHWDEAAFIKSTKILMQRGAITESSQAQYTTAHRPTNLHLHFLPFLQGMLYVGSDVPLSDDEVQLAQNLADAFSTAYARYEDFNKLEAANNKIEKTLVDLKQTQSQLVQSEKMASLGELTAGIAHEIQNPLNFVNNFSEINKEILEEMKEELAIGNKQLATGHPQEAQDKIEQAIAIANDVIDNSEKINHHGKRAESIVKGMLQHSRKSTGMKEPTDINALADEYMRLSYHGLRAKDKSFNADFKMDLDPTLPLVNVIPQDIGRVLLNLFNNAFWAANERKNGEMEKWRTESADSISGLPSSGLPFSPSVTLTTKNLSDHIEIRIADNGPGIPPHIIDKIFQPFFTTKPTGQGTGLGLSLAYDIIKAHGGELNVVTNEGEALPSRYLSGDPVGRGSEFIIWLPIKTNQ